MQIHKKSTGNLRNKRGKELQSVTEPNKRSKMPSTNLFCRNLTPFNKIKNIK